MSDIVSDLVAKCGVSTDQAKKGLGAVLSFVKQSFPKDTFAKVSAAIPGSDQMMALAGDANPSGGVLESIKGVAGKLFGSAGGAIAPLIAKLSSFGFSPDKAHSFLAHVMEHLKDKLPDSVTQQLSGLLPTMHETTA